MTDRGPNDRRVWEKAVVVHPVKLPSKQQTTQEEPAPEKEAPVETASHDEELTDG